MAIRLFCIKLRYTWILKFVEYLEISDTALPLPFNMYRLTSSKG